MKPASYSYYILLLCLLITPIYSCNKDDEEDENGEDNGITWVSCGGSTIDITTYYVSTAGNDANDGKSLASAFRNISKAFTVIRPGGKILIAPGIYFESIGLQSCGTGNKSPLIHVEGYQGQAVMDGQNKKPIGIFGEGCYNMLFSNIKFQNYTDIGIGFEKSGHLVLQNLEVLENGHNVQLTDWELEGYGIHVETSTNVDISDNVVYRNGPDPQKFPDYLMGTGINTFGNSHVNISNNISYRNIGGGILVEDSYHVVVENNEVYENDLDATVDGWWDGGLWLDGGGNVIVKNNNFHHNLGPGIEVSDEDLQYPKGYVLENNKSNNNYYGIFIWNFGTTSWPDTSIIKNINNDFSGNSIKDVWIEAWF